MSARGCEQNDEGSRERDQRGDQPHATDRNQRKGRSGARRGRQRDNHAPSGTTPGERRHDPRERRQHEGHPAGDEQHRQPASARSRVGPERADRDRLQAPRRQAQPRPAERGRDARGDARPVSGLHQEPHTLAVLGQVPAEGIGAPDDVLAGRLAVTLAAAAGQDQPGPRGPRAVDGDVEQRRRPTRRDPGDVGDALLGKRQRLSVRRRVDVVDLDGHLVQRQEADRLPVRAPRHGRRPRRCPGERIGRPGDAHAAQHRRAGDHRRQDSAHPAKRNTRVDQSGAPAAIQAVTASSSAGGNGCGDRLARRHLTALAGRAVDELAHEVARRRIAGDDQRPAAALVREAADQPLIRLPRGQRQLGVAADPGCQRRARVVATGAMRIEHRLDGRERGALPLR